MRERKGRKGKKEKIKEEGKRKIRDRNHKQNERVVMVKAKADLRPWE